MIRVTVRNDVTMPHLCCACGTGQDVHLVNTRLSDDWKRWKGRLPYCTGCKRADRRRSVIATLLVGLAMFAVTAIAFAVDGRGARDGGSMVEHAFVVLIVAALATWKLAPNLRPRAVKLVLLEKQKGIATFGCSNQRFADALADQNAAAPSALPVATLTSR